MHPEQEKSLSEISALITRIVVIVLLCAVVLGVGFTVLKRLGQSPAGSDKSAIPAMATPTAVKYSLSGKEAVCIKAAVNAVGEIDSVASVGVTYLQFMNAVQSSRIKFDAAMRDCDSYSETGLAAAQSLEEAFSCYMDAKSAWTEFIEDGDEYGFLTPKSYSKVQQMSLQYNYHSNGGQYYRSTVVSAILDQGSIKFRTVAQAIR